MHIYFVHTETLQNVYFQICTQTFFLSHLQISTIKSLSAYVSPMCSVIYVNLIVGLQMSSSTYHIQILYRPSKWSLSR